MSRVGTKKDVGDDDIRSRKLKTYQINHPLNKCRGIRMVSSDAVQQHNFIQLAVEAARMQPAEIVHLVDEGALSKHCAHELDAERLGEGVARPDAGHLLLCGAERNSSSVADRRRVNVKDTH